MPIRFGFLVRFGRWRPVWKLLAKHGQSIVSYLEAALLAALLYVALGHLPLYDPILMRVLPLLAAILTLLNLRAGIGFFAFAVVPPLLFASPELALVYLAMATFLFLQRSDALARAIFLAILMIALGKSFLAPAVLLIAGLRFRSRTAFWFGFLSCLALELLSVMFGVPALGGLAGPSKAAIAVAAGPMPPVSDWSWVSKSLSDLDFSQFFGSVARDFVSDMTLVFMPIVWGIVGSLVNKYRRPSLGGTASCLALGSTVLAVSYYVASQFPSAHVKPLLIVPAMLTSFMAAFAYSTAASELGSRVRIAKARLVGRDGTPHPIDSLTGLLSREYLKHPLDEVLDTAVHNQEIVSFAMIDLDRFKQINDSKGHQVGDEVLVDTAMILSDAIGSSGIVIRYAGDEFSAIFPRRKADDAKVIMAEAARALASHHFRGLDKVLRPTLSVGIAEFPRMTTTKEELIGLADSALYMSKNLGRNTITVFGGHDYASQALELECWMQEAVSLAVGERIRIDSWRIHKETATVEAVTLFEYATKQTLVSDSAGTEDLDRPTYKSSFLGKVVAVSPLDESFTMFSLLVQRDDLPIRVKKWLETRAPVEEFV